MDNAGDVVISCASQERIVGAVDRVISTLPKEVRGPLDDIVVAMLQQIGPRGMFRCLNGKSVSAIIAEYGGSFKPEEIAAGEVEGMHFRLYESPADKLQVDELGRPIHHNNQDEK